MHEISFEKIKGGSVRLEQQSGFGEANVILLHPEQLAFITRRTCGVNAATANDLEDLERKLAILADEIEFFAGLHLEQILHCCHDGQEITVSLDAIRSLAREFDGGRLTPRRQDKAEESAPEPSKRKAAPKAPASTEKAADSDCRGLGEPLLI